MSVYHEALKAGRIRRHAFGGQSLSRQLREIKRLEAEERNRHTPYERTAACRRELATARAKRGAR